MSLACALLGANTLELREFLRLIPNTFQREEGSLHSRAKVSSSSSLGWIFTGLVGASKGWRCCVWNVKHFDKTLDLPTWALQAKSDLIL